MKKIILLLMITISITVSASAQTVILNPKNKPAIIVNDNTPVLGFPSPDDRETRIKRRKNYPPGQAKKIYGKQSAREFAHGKKKGGKGKGKWKNKD